MFVLNVPDDVLSRVFSCLISLSSLVKLDSALCNHEIRNYVIGRLFSHSSFRIPYLHFKCSQTLVFLNWISQRKISVESYCFKLFQFSEIVEVLNFITLWPQIFYNTHKITLTGFYQFFGFPETGSNLARLVNSCPNLQHLVYYNLHSRSPTVDHLWWFDKINVNILIKLQTFDIHDTLKAAFADPFLLANVTKHFVSLTKLSLACDRSCNSLSFGDTIRRNVLTLTSLELQNCMISKAFLELMMNILPNTLESLSLLRCYDLSEVEQRLSLDEYLVSNLIEFKLLQFADISICLQFGSEVVQSFGFDFEEADRSLLLKGSLDKTMIQTTLRLFKNLAELNFSDINFEDHDMAVVTSLLKYSPNLQMISFVNCESLSVDSAQVIVNYKTVVAVHFDGCDDLRACDIQKILCQKVKENLRYIAVSNQTDFALEYLFTIVMNNSQLTHVLVSCCCPFSRGDVDLVRANLEKVAPALQLEICEHQSASFERVAYDICNLYLGHSKLRY